MELFDATDYFATARERERIRLRRADGQPPPWTEDEVLANFRFCNVHREHDKTTEWFRTHVRELLTGASAFDQVAATIAFRWFNRIEVGEIIQDLLVEKWDTEEARTRLEQVQPIVTGAYMIKTPEGMNKLDGVLYSIDRARQELPSILAEWTSKTPLQTATEDLTWIQGLGPFLAFEIVSDLRWSILHNAPDIMTWANAGPGCTHGLGRLFERDNPWRWKRGNTDHQKEMVEVMLALLEMSKHEDLWLQSWRPWEMREVEHWACEYDKWCRGKNNERLKRRFRYETTTT